MLLSLFCGAGGLDLGFEDAQFKIGLACDTRADSVKSYNHNRSGPAVAHVADVRELTPERLDVLYGGPFHPNGVIGGPPCQSFSMANRSVPDNDPRHELPFVYARLIAALHARSPLQFFVLENVTGLRQPPHVERFTALKDALRAAGFTIAEAVLDAASYGTPQHRERVFVVGFSAAGNVGAWEPPGATTTDSCWVTVRTAIGALEEPTYFARGLDSKHFPVHPNHWCMQPKSAKFTQPGRLVPGNGWHRSFKTLAWDAPSFTVAYGNREVHIHPERHRRLSVFEAMQLQGFPRTYELLGHLSSQITQVSEAVPPPLAHAVAVSIRSQLFAPGATLLPAAVVPAPHDGQDGSPADGAITA